VGGRIELVQGFPVYGAMGFDRGFIIGSYADNGIQLNNLQIPQLLEYQRKSIHYFIGA
jgi:hypothetical protein